MAAVTICSDFGAHEISPYVKQIISGSLMYDAGHPNSRFFDGLEEWAGQGGKLVQKGGNTCVPMANSWCCMTKTITILLGNYPHMEIFFFNCNNSNKKMKGTSGLTAVHNCFPQLCLLGCFLFVCFVFLCFFGPMACKILAPWPGMTPPLPTAEAQSPTLWTTREFP